MRAGKRQRRSSGRSASSTASSMCSATASVTCGRLLGDVELARLRTPASVRSSQIRRTAASVSESKSNSTEWTISAGQARDPVRVERRRAHRLELRRLVSDPAPSAIPRATAPSPKAPRGCPSRLIPDPAATHRSPGRRTKHLCEASASSVSAAWFNVPRPGRDDHEHRRSEIDREITKRHPAVTDLDEQTARALDQRQPARPVHRGDHRAQLTARRQRQPCPLRRGHRRQRLGKPRGRAIR